MASFVFVVIELVLIIGLHVTATSSDSFKCDRLIRSNNYCPNFTKLEVETQWLVGDCLATCDLKDECEAIALLRKNETSVQCYIQDTNGDARLNESAEILVKKEKIESYRNRRCSEHNQSAANTGTETTTADAEQGCPDNFITQIGNMAGCYYVSQSSKKWAEAEAHCQNLDPRAHLIIFETWQEQQAVTGVPGTSWTGGKDLYNNDTLYWTRTGERVSTDSNRWMFDDLHHSRGDCVVVYNGKMMLVTCEGNTFFICEINM